MSPESFLISGVFYFIIMFIIMVNIMNIVELKKETGRAADEAVN